jgi:hypothetical protein
LLPRASISLSFTLSSISEQVRISPGARLR